MGILHNRLFVYFINANLFSELLIFFILNNHFENFHVFAPQYALNVKKPSIPLV